MKVQDAVKSQLGFWHGIMEGVIGECGKDVVNKQVPGATVTSIGSIYAHAVFAEDGIVNGMLQGKPLLFQSDGWQQKTGVSWPSEPGNAPSINDSWAKSLNMDFPKFQEYAKAVFANTDAYISGLPDSDLDRKVQTPIGEQNVGWVISTLLGTHFPQHAGEIAALKGVQGLKGLPF